MFGEDKLINEQQCRVRVYKTSIRAYVQIFNQAFGAEFDQWLFSRLIDNKTDKCAEHILLLNSDSFDDDEIEDIALTIKDSMTKACYPFVFIKILVLVKEGIWHANTMLIEYTEDYKNIVITYYKPHGRDAKFHETVVDIPKLLELVKEKLIKEGYDKDSIRIAWGCPRIGIQHKDRLGLCLVFNRFWSYITLQLLKKCKGMNETKGFIEPLTREGERYVTSVVKKHYPSEPDKEYDVIITWMYRMILEYLGSNSKDYSKEQIQKHLGRIIEECKFSIKMQRECSISEEYWPMSRCYSEFNSEYLNISKPKDIEEREAYINKLLDQFQLMDTSD